MRSRVAFFLLAVLLFPVFQSAQQAPASVAVPPIVRDPQAMAVLATASRALGGSFAAAITDSVVQATETSTTPNSALATLTLKSKGLDEFRMEGTTGGAYSSTPASVATPKPIRTAIVLFYLQHHNLGQPAHHVLQLRGWFRPQQWRPHSVLIHRRPGHPVSFLHVRLAQPPLHHDGHKRSFGLHRPLLELR